MKSQRWKWAFAIAFFFVSSKINLSYLYDFFLNKKTEPIIIGKMDLRVDSVPLQSAVVRIENDSYILMTYYTNPKTPDIYTPVYLYPLDKKNGQALTPLKFAQAQHVRHVSHINTPWGKGVIIADHGVDNSDFLGGRLILLVKDASDRQLKDLSTKLPLYDKKNTSFNVVALRRSHAKHDDILVVPYNSRNSQPHYFEAKENGYVDASHKLPKNWREKKVCFMTGISYDIDYDHRDEVVLGGCDMDLKWKPLDRDQLLVWKNNRWKFESRSIFPLRKKELGWGTVFWQRDDLNNDKRQDLVALTHNWGFTKADIQIFHRNPRTEYFDESIVSTSLENFKNFSYYFHEVKSYRSKRNKKKYLMVLVRFITDSKYDQENLPRHNLFILENDKKSNKWVEVKTFLDIPKNESILGIDVANLANEKDSSLIVTYYSGRYDIFKF